MTDDGVDLVIPGLEPAAAGAGKVEMAARATLEALRPRLRPEHAIITATVLTLAAQLDRSHNSGRGKDYGVAQVAAQLRETWQQLPLDDTEGGAGDAFDILAGELRCAAHLCDHEEHRATV